MPNSLTAPLGSRINWRHPLSSGVRVCFLFNTGPGTDPLATNVGPLDNALRWVKVGTPRLSPDGLALDGASHYYTLRKVYEWHYPRYPVTVFGVATTTSTAVSQQFFQIGQVGADNLGWCARFVTGTPRKVQLCNNGGYPNCYPGSVLWDGFAACDWSPGTPYRVGYSVVGGFRAAAVKEIVGVVNGVGKVSTATGHDGYPTAEGLVLGGGIKITPGSGDVFRWNGTVHFVAAWTRALSLAELLQLDADPFCFLELAPARKRWVIDLGGEPEEITGSASLTLAGLTCSAAGSVAVAGSASLSLSALGNSASGAVAVVGSAALTLAALTVSASASGVVQGAATLTLDACVAGAAGAVAIAGGSALTLGAVALGAGGGVAVAGSGACALATVTASGAGSVAVVGGAGNALAAILASCQGAVAVAGAAALSVGNLGVAASDEVDTAHVHAVQGATEEANHVPPYYALAYIMKL